MPVETDQMTQKAIKVLTARGPDVLMNLMALISEAVQNLKTSPRYEQILELCVATRCAWSEYHSQWLLKRFRQTDGVTEQLRAGIEEGLAAMEKVPDPTVEKENARLLQFRESIRFRGELLDLLLTQGPEAVDERLTKHLQTLEKRA